MGVQDRKWYWKDRARDERAWYDPRQFQDQGARPRSRKSRNRLPLVTWVMCLLLLVIIGTAVIRWRAPPVVKPVPVSDDALEESQRQARQREAEALQAQQQALIDRRAAEMRAFSERQRLEAESNRAAAETNERKARAWAKFYRSPAGCDAAATVECANDRIRARRVFEAEFAKGRFQ
jgi:hypothetical protein